MSGLFQRLVGGAERGAVSARPLARYERAEGPGASERVEPTTAEPTVLPVSGAGPDPVPPAIAEQPGVGRTTADRMVADHTIATPQPPTVRQAHGPSLRAEHGEPVQQGTDSLHRSSSLATITTGTQVHFVFDAVPIERTDGHDAPTARRVLHEVLGDTGSPTSRDIIVPSSPVQAPIDDAEEAPSLITAHERRKPPLDAVIKPRPEAVLFPDRDRPLRPVHGVDTPENAPSQPPIIEISIGHIEVRAPQPAPRPVAPARFKPVMGLDEYLQRRNQGRP